MEETTQETVTESTQEVSSGAGDVSTTTAVEQNAAGMESNDTPQPQTTESVTDSSIAAAIYKPNFKFKVKDKELEFDEAYKPWVKNQEDEKKLRDLHERAFGLDEVKQSRDSVKKQYEEMSSKYNEVESSLKTLGTYVKKGDFRSFFDILNIPKDKIINYAIEELKYAELPADQKAIIDQQRNQQLEFESRVSENQQLQSKVAQLVQQQTTFELNQEFAKPEVSQVAQAYDSRAGKPGAFQAEVIRRGQYYEAVHNISPTATQLVGEVLNLIGSNPVQSSQGMNAPTQQQVMQGQHNSGSQTQKQKPVITTLSGNAGKSPTKKVYSSLDDLRKARQNLQA